MHQKKSRWNYLKEVKIFHFSAHKNSCNPTTNTNMLGPKMKLKIGSLKVSRRPLKTRTEHQAQDTIYQLPTWEIQVTSRIWLQGIGRGEGYLRSIRHWTTSGLPNQVSLQARLFQGRTCVQAVYVASSSKSPKQVYSEEAQNWSDHLDTKENQLAVRKFQGNFKKEKKEWVWPRVAVGAWVHLHIQIILILK